MQRLAFLFGIITLSMGAASSYLVAVLITDYLERQTVRAVTHTVLEAGVPWASVRADGLTVSVSGPAPDEAARFNLLNLVGTVVNSNRIVDNLTVVDALALEPPRFSLELLRNGDGISLIGLIPEKTGRTHILDMIDEINHDTKVTDMLETADHVIPDGWDAALEFGLVSLQNLPRSKISITDSAVTITAITDSPEEKKRIETDLARAKPDGVLLVMQISSPRPVITPFSLRVIMDQDGTRFDSCSADNDESRRRIIAAASAAGLTGKALCAIGLGVPTPRWAEAVELAIGSLAELRGGSLTFSDADITLVARADTPQSIFDRVAHNLEVALPDVFSLHAVLPPKPLIEGAESEVEVPEFTATRSPEGLVQLRGRMRDARTQVAARNYAKSLFGSENVDDSTRIDSALPDGWPTRVLASLEALGELHNGSILIQPDTVEIRGVADVPEATSEVTRIMSVRLGEASDYRIFVKYEAALDRRVIPPTAQECVDRINAILSEQQIAFAPSSTKIEEDSLMVVEKIAEAMTDCSEVPMEIGGHTDSQGRESLNQTISQARAEAVLDNLLSLEILTTFLSAKGYGEKQPIADNDTAEGRKANRRIEFKLIEEPTEDAEQTIIVDAEDTTAEPEPSE